MSHHNDYRIYIKFKVQNIYKIKSPSHQGISGTMVMNGLRWRRVKGSNPVVDDF